MTAKFVRAVNGLGQGEVGVCGGVDLEGGSARGGQDLGFGHREREDVDGMGCSCQYRQYTRGIEASTIVHGTPREILF